MMIALQALVLPLYEENPDEVGDLYFDVAEAYMEMGCYREAEPILAQLVHSYKYNLVRSAWMHKIRIRKYQKNLCWKTDMDANQE